MKARIKATGEIVEVELSHYIGDVTWYITKCLALYHENELEFIDTPEDYWTRLEHQAAIAAMQGILSNPRIMETSGCKNDHERLVETTISIAHALVEKYKKEE